MGKKFIVGSSGSGKTVKALREAWGDVKAGNRVVFAYVYGDFDVNDGTIRFALGSEYDEFINSSLIRFVKVGVDMSDSDIANINDAFEYNTLNVLYVDGANDEVSRDLIDGVDTFVHVFQHIPSNVHTQGVTVEETTISDRTGR